MLLYREMIGTYLDGERYPVPAFTLGCMRHNAQWAIRNFRLNQIALLSTVHDPESRIKLAQTFEEMAGKEDDVMEILTHFHNECLETEYAEAARRKKEYQLHLRAQRSVVRDASLR